MTTIVCPVCSHEEPLPADIEALQERRPSLPGIFVEKESNDGP